MRPRSLAVAGEIQVGCVQGDGIYLFDKALSKRMRLGDCDEKESEVRSQLISSSDSTTTEIIILVGYRNLRKHRGLRIWEYHQGSVSPVDFTIVSSQNSNTQALPGFGFAACGTNAESHLVYFGTGLGKGVARLWVLDKNNQTVKPLASFKAKHTSIASILIFPNERKFVVGSSYDSCVQEWNFDTFVENPLVYSGKDCLRTLTRKEIREELLEKFPDFVEDVQNPDLRTDVLTFVQDHPEWSCVFPPSTVDPTAYEGETNEENGLPHGRGRQLLADGIVFEGEWINGNPIRGVVKGQRFEYRGQVNGEEVLPHGWGVETRNRMGAEIEIYSGGWKDGERHGIYSLTWQNTNPEKSRNHGIREYGFYRNGKPHGLLFHEWASDAPEMPFALGKESEARSLGAIRCIQQKRDGKVLDEFHFHKVNGSSWTPVEKTYLNVPEISKGPASFAEEPRTGQHCGRSDRLECWACLQAEEENDAMCHTCLGCNMRVHKACAWPEEYFVNNNKFPFGWICLMCESQINRGGLLFVVYDRHGEPVVVENKDDLIHTLSSTMTDSNQEHPIVLYPVS